MAETWPGRASRSQVGQACRLTRRARCPSPPCDRRRGSAGYPPISALNDGSSRIAWSGLSGAHSSHPVASYASPGVPSKTRIVVAGSAATAVRRMPCRVKMRVPGTRFDLLALDLEDRAPADDDEQLHGRLG